MQSEETPRAKQSWIFETIRQAGSFYLHFKVSCVYPDNPGSQSCSDSHDLWSEPDVPTPQSLAQNHLASLSAVWSPNNDLWDNGIFIPEIVGFRFYLCMTAFFRNGFRLTPTHTQNRANGPLCQRKKRRTSDISYVRECKLIVINRKCNL